MLTPQIHEQSPLLSQVALVVAVVGALVVTVSSVLVIFRITGWYLAGLFMAVGNALIGLWLLGLNYTAQHSHLWSNGLAISGMISCCPGLRPFQGYSVALIPGNPPPGISTTLGGLAPWDGWFFILPGAFGWAALSCFYKAVTVKR